MSDATTRARGGLRVAFRNDRFVAVDKPAGWLSVPSRMGASDERPCAGRALEADLAARTWPVHRLDEDVSGLLLFALDAEAHAEGNRWFERRLVTKTYEALTEMPAGARPEPGPHVWESRLLRGKRRAYESPHGKPATTRARLVGDAVAQGQAALAWSLEPVTGRPHQLRVELARRIAPVVGDTLYGARAPLPGGAIALRCVALAFQPAAGAASFGLPAELRVEPLERWLAELQADG